MLFVIKYSYLLKLSNYFRISLFLKCQKFFPESLFCYTPIKQLPISVPTGRNTYRCLDASFHILQGFFEKTYFTLLEVALRDFPDSESLLESDSDLDSEELSSDEVDSVSEQLDALLFLEIPFAFFLLSSESLHIEKKNLRDVENQQRNLLRHYPTLTFQSFIKQVLSQYFFMIKNAAKMAEVVAHLRIDKIFLSHFTRNHHM